MKNELKKFSLRLFILTIILALAGLLFSQFLPADMMSPAWPFLIIFFFLFTLALFYVTLKSVQSRFSRFVNYYMLMTVGKLFFFLALIVVYVLMNRQDAWTFVLTFFILYLVYTFFELVYFLRFIESGKNKGQ